MNSISFSVLMCVYEQENAAHFEAAIKSILVQTVKPTEIVLVVDGPIPQTLEDVIKQYQEDPIFHVVRLEKNQGHGIARRVGLQHCKHEFVAVMDADDISENTRFEKQLAVFAKNPQVSVVGGNITEFIDTTENTVGIRTVYLTDAEIKQDLKKRCPMNLVTVMFKKADVEKVGGFEDWYCEEDYYLWIRMFQADMQFANVADNLVYVRVGEEMYQRRGGLKYFISEAKLQNYMLKHGLIGFGTYVVNIAKRLIVQVLMPNKIRSWAFQKFARKAV